MVLISVSVVIATFRLLGYEYVLITGAAVLARFSAKKAVGSRGERWNGFS
ncbi:hypothetical protein MGG_15544 [Pyricularia oryzae 70-15]|uniref:Uncharacterized protein n=1 Tax=Pyricularia oryzae (strain 70-15 / ATCC MYA-4617 / FGSC 8958) TaxID=242507 RepID=G4MSF3_PYRO7|nr:uncharacterized protein MGG_15544 [Pyricularia oryzae 70-15]EHA53765.1 hypothetical protein MGG_15544 [Pyricularia oryzae 70-15]